MGLVGHFKGVVLIRSEGALSTTTCSKTFSRSAKSNIVYNTLRFLCHRQIMLPNNKMYDTFFCRLSVALRYGIKALLNSKKNP